MKDILRNIISVCGKTLEDEDGRYRISPLALFFWPCISFVKHVSRLVSGTCFLSCKAHQKSREPYVGSQIWQMPRPTGLTGRADRSDRSSPV